MDTDSNCDESPNWLANIITDLDTSRPNDPRKRNANTNSVTYTIRNASCANFDANPHGNGVTDANAKCAANLGITYTIGGNYRRYRRPG